MKTEMVIRNLYLHRLMYEGKFVRLRALEMDDLEPLMRYINDVETRQFLGSLLPNSTKSEKEWLESKTSINPWKNGDIVLAMETKASKEFLGTISLFDISTQHRHAEFGIALWNADMRNKGYGTDATTVMLWVGFHVLGLNNIYLYAHSDNARALQVYEKVGFKKIGVYREMIFSMGKFHDHVAMDILRSEFLERYPPGSLPSES